MGILVSAHNPMTGPRHLGHYVSTMLEWPSLQKEHECFFVIDDLIANLMYPSDREAVLNRSLFVAREFLASGISRERGHIVLTSSLTELSEALALTMNFVDTSYLKGLYQHSFLGMLAPHQRSQLGLKVTPRLSEVVYPQLGMPTLALFLRADHFQGGLEISGYVYIMQELAGRIAEDYGDIVRPPDWMQPKTPYLRGTDGNHMITDNAWLLSLPADKQDALRDSRSVPYDVVVEWAEALQIAERKQEDMLRGIEQHCEKFRDFRISNEELLDLLADGAARAKFQLRETLERLKSSMHIPQILEY